MQYARMKPNELAKKIREREQQMFKHAQDLEFEEAANLHDKIHPMQVRDMGLMQWAGLANGSG